MDGRKMCAECEGENPTPLSHCACRQAALTEANGTEEIPCPAETPATEASPPARVTASRSERQSSSSAPAMGFFLSGFSILLIASVIGITYRQIVVAHTESGRSTPPAVLSAAPASAASQEIAVVWRTVQTVRAHGDENNATGAPESPTRPDIRELAAATRGADYRWNQDADRISTAYRADGYYDANGIWLNHPPLANAPSTALAEGNERNFETLSYSGPMKKRGSIRPDWGE